jgi:hypothetical protein
VRLGKRSTWLRAGVGRELIRQRAVQQAAGAVLAAGFAMAALVAPAAAQRAAPATVGPGRIVCNASFCEMGSGARPKERVRVIVSNLPQEEVRRLRKCTGVAKPCIVTIAGTEQGDQMKILANTIQWQE